MPLDWENGRPKFKTQSIQHQKNRLDDDSDSTLDLPDLMDQMEALEKNCLKMESYYSKQVVDLKAQLIEKDNEHKRLTRQLMNLKSLASDQMKKVEVLSCKYQRRSNQPQLKSISPKFKNRPSGKKDFLNLNSDKYLFRNKNGKDFPSTTLEKNNSANQRTVKNVTTKKNLFIQAREEGFGEANIFSSQELYQRKKIVKRISPNRQNDSKRESKKVSEFKIEIKEAAKKSIAKTGLGSLRQRVALFK